jgi:hypothetical protein
MPLQVGMTCCCPHQPAALQLHGRCWALAASRPAAARTYVVQHKMETILTGEHVQLNGDNGGDMVDEHGLAHRMISGRLFRPDVLVIGGILACLMLHCEKRQPAAKGVRGMTPAGCCCLLEQCDGLVMRHNGEVNRYCCTACRRM